MVADDPEYDLQEDEVIVELLISLRDMVYMQICVIHGIAHVILLTMTWKLNTQSMTIKEIVISEYQSCPQQ